MNQTRNVVDVNNVCAKCKLKFTIYKHYIVYPFNYKTYKFAMKVLWRQETVQKSVKLKYYLKNIKSTESLMQHIRQRIC